MTGTNGITENLVEDTCLDWPAELGWETDYGPNLAPDMPDQERDNYQQVLLIGRLRAALMRINPDVPANVIDEAIRHIKQTDSPDLLVGNRRFHRLLTDGIDVEILDNSHQGGSKYIKVWLVDLENCANNDWLALNQYTVIEGNQQRRADVVVFINGLPLAVLELKNPADENATIKQAFNQLQTYKQTIPSLFVTNELLVISDGILARCGTLSSAWDRFMPWRTLDGESIADKGTPELEIIIRGLFKHQVFLDYILNFTVFEDDGATIHKKSAAYHQYWAVNKALACTLSACGIDADATKLIGRFSKESNPWQINEIPTAYGKGSQHFGDNRIGVIWHTQGSGKSLSMTFYAGKVIRHPAMGNPTLVVITDRNDLDDQLFATFAGCKALLRQSPVQADSRVHLRGLLKVASGGVVFTTIQKFLPDKKGDAHPLLSSRSNIVVIASCSQ
ncbi:MAG: type I restriction endonuclease subunit R [Gammaproteobacteria bacterium]|nr:type I restriction endonuclease subunit R [Gammaproteobacteria bacterium]